MKASPGMETSAARTEDTDAETLAAYGQAYPLHTKLGRPIIDGSMEYWETLHGSLSSNPPAATDGEGEASTNPRTIPTIRTESQRMILLGTGDKEVIADEVAERMERLAEPQCEKPNRVPRCSSREGTAVALFSYILTTILYKPRFKHSDPPL